MRTYIDIIPRPVVVTAPAVQLTRGLWCETEGKWMPHSLNKSETAYVCSCSTEVIYIVNHAPHLWAV